MELNRLATGGVNGYPSPGNLMDADLAANVWAGTQGLALIGALNVKAGNVPGFWIDINAVCNQLAGTSGLEPVDALAARVS